MYDRETIIQDYGALMERKPPLPTRIEDVSALPHPKATILDALLSELGQGHSAHMAEMLRIGAISLAQYQPGVGREPLEMLGADASKVPATLAEAKRLAPALSKMQYRFKELDKLVQDDLQRIKSRIATAESQRRISRDRAATVPARTMDSGRRTPPRLSVHHGLEAIGTAIAQITKLALVALLFAAPLFAAIFASLFAAVEVGRLIGGGAFVAFVLFWLFIGLVGFYVAPRVQPQIRKAMAAVLDSTSDTDRT
jgi:hypothetical protein